MINYNSSHLNFQAMATSIYCRFGIIVLFLFTAISSSAQSVNAPFSAEYYHLVERYEIQQGYFSPQLFTVMRPYSRKGIAQWADTLSQLSDWSRADQFNLAYLKNDNWEWVPESTEESKKPFPIIKKLYRRPSDMYHVQEKNFDLHVNPVLSAGIGNSSDRVDRIYASGRGVELRGSIANKVGFYTFITDNQALFPQYIMGKPGVPTNLPTASKNGALPQTGFWKDLIESNGVEFFRARGHISVDLIDEISIQVGHDRHFVGHGYRSTTLSDFSPNYFFIRINTKVWKFNYTNLYATIAPRALKDGDVFKDKFFAMHHLSLNIRPNLNVGVFENVVFSRGDSIQSNKFDPNYLNPVIFSRAVEHNRASLDNVLLGFDAKWIPFKRLQVYGQLTLDEFKTLEFLGINDDGSYLNKYGAQLGFKYIDVLGVPNLDLQGEWNKVRPFTYSHNQSGQRPSVNDANYQHFGLPLAHPLGSNFWEVIGVLRYQPIPRLQLQATAIYAELGEDPPGENWGGDILKDFNDPIQTSGNSVGQGIGATLQFVDLTATYQFRHNLFIDLKHIMRNFDSEDDARDLQTSYTSVTLRLNIPQWRYEF